MMSVFKRKNRRGVVKKAKLSFQTMVSNFLDYNVSTIEKDVCFETISFKKVHSVFDFLD